MAIWSDPNNIVPYHIPAPRPQMNNFSKYVKEVIEEEIKEKSMRMK